jgi:hypothetical protein
VLLGFGPTTLIEIGFASVRFMLVGLPGGIGPEQYSGISTATLPVDGRYISPELDTKPPMLPNTMSAQYVG